MLTVHHSNRLDVLAEALAAVTRETLGSVFSSEVVLVQSRGVARWLALELAARSGVCANIRFPFPAAFAWELYRTVCAKVPEQSAFDPEILTWRVLRLLPELEALPAFAAVQNYVRGDHVRRFELAVRLAQLFDEYLIYRPDWIARWERGKPEPWQAMLWQRLARESNGAHRAAFQAELLTALSSATALPAGVPQRISVFGAPALAPTLLDLFHALGRVSEVHLFIQNPCREYWGDIAPEGEIARKALAGSPDARYVETGNALLASLGKQGRDFIDLITESGGAGLEEQDHFVDPGRDTLLGSIQSDILNLEERTPAVAASSPIENDASFQVHACHSAMREVEVLHDQLLALFGRFPDLEPSDVVVMTPDIETYSPYIEAVFGTAQPPIPYNISDRSSERESTLAGVFLALLELAGSRYDANRVLGVLDESAVRRRFGLAEGDVETVRTWVRDAQIRWGIDAAHRARLGLPATHEHTWRFGLERLLLGYSLPAQKERVFEGVLAYDDVEGSLGDILGRFTSFAEAALALEAQFAGAKPVSRWCVMLHALISTFFDATQERAEELEAVRAAVAAIDRESRIAKHADAVPLAVIIAALRARLEVPGRAFLSGGVTFCAMVPMRSLPFEVVCMIGMNDRAYPRVRRRDAFDLMAETFRKGDRSRRDDDRYLFLESILNAGRCLYMSYTGRHIREDTIIPPSVLVDELLDYVARENAELRERLVTRHPLQAFSRKYFGGDPKLFSYSPTLARAASVAGRGRREPKPFLTTDLASPDLESRVVDLDTFIRFFRNPVRHLFEQRLKVRLETPDEEIEAHEPFQLHGLSLFDLKQRLLDLRLRNVTHDGLALARAGGDLPHGRVGEALYAVEAENVDRVARVLSPFLGEPAAEPIRVEIRGRHVTLTGALPNVGSGGMLDWRMSRANEHVRIRAWIRHLALNACAPPNVGRTSRCVSQQCVLTFSPVEDPGAKLSELLDLYWLGLHRPLRFFPRAAWAYMDAGREIGWKVRTVWEGSRRDDEGPRGECEDLYYQLAFRGADPLDQEFERIALTVFAPMLAAMKEEPLG